MALSICWMTQSNHFLCKMLVPYMEFSHLLYSIYLPSPKPTEVIEKNSFNFSGIQNKPWANDHLQMARHLTHKIFSVFSLVEYLIKKNTIKMQNKECLLLTVCVSSEKNPNKIKIWKTLFLLVDN